MNAFTMTNVSSHVGLVYTVRGCIVNILIPTHFCGQIKTRWEKFFYDTESLSKCVKIDCKNCPRQWLYTHMRVLVCMFSDVLISYTLTMQTRKIIAHYSRSLLSIN
jgi:hypothetical protein